MAVLVAASSLAGAVEMGMSTSAAAQDDCSAEVEPNDAPEVARLTSGHACLVGSLEPGDQDLMLWDVPSSSVGVSWTFDLDGVAGTLTSLQLFDVASAPGEKPVIVERQPILQLNAPPEGDGRARREGVLLTAGQYLLGITRSGLPGGGEPADIAYRYAIEAGQPAPALDIEPNDDAETAGEVSDAFSISGDLEGSKDTFAWTVPTGDERWALDLLVPLGEVGSWQLSDSDGQVFADASGATRIRAWDLALPAGEYLVTVSPQANESRPYQLSADRIAPAWDAEPNDESIGAVPVADGELVRGRLAGDGDRDRFSLQVPAGEAVLRSVRMLWDGDIDRQLCLTGGDGPDVLCRRGSGGVALTDLALQPGRHVFEVRGPEDPELPYALRIDATSAVVPDFEAEPNDDADHATAVDPDLDMRARGGDEDIDVFRLTTDGEPQLWEVAVAGPDLRYVRLTGPSGRSFQNAHVGPDRSNAVLTDLYLVPGDHWFAVSTGVGEYTLEATPLGPPPVDGEHEPNSEALRSERYRIGSSRTGRLPDSSDRDFYRFTLAAPQHIGLRLEPPPDASIGLRLSSGEQPIGSLRNLPGGEAVVWDLDLQPGDYLLELVADAAAEGRYRLTSEQLDPYRLAEDQEPNGGPAWARDVPASLAWQGSMSDGSDEDWYRLPQLSGPDPLVVRLQGDRPRARVKAGDEWVTLDRAEDGSFILSDVVPDVQHYLALAAEGAYEVELQGSGLAAEAVERDLPVDLEWSFETDEVAAYWPEGQRLDGSLRLVSRSDEPLEVVLETSTSHVLWTADPQFEMVAIPPGEVVDVPVAVEILADAWADEPVLVAARVADLQYRATSAATTLTASPTAPPQAPHLAWPLPGQLLGGLNAASLGLGAIPHGTVDADRELELYDGVTPDRAGFVKAPPGGDLPLELMVDLAGDEPVPVTGTIINPQAGAGRLAEAPRRFELLLSQDGSNWEPAISGELSPSPIDQVFVLDEPQDARYATLRITELHVDRATNVAIGEWKVVLEPGTAPSTDELDIGSAALGGHIVTMMPQQASDALAASMLDDGLDRESTPIGDDRRVEVVLGLQDGRAARIDRLEWLDPDGSVPAERLERVMIETSLGGPGGPWVSVATWDLERAADGSVPPFGMDDSAWVRYVRLSGTAPDDARALELPGALRVMEHATDSEYRSILGEWGYASRAGPFEWASTSESAAETIAAEDAADDRLTATPLHADEVRADRVEIGLDEDWFTIAVPADDNTLELVVRGEPTVRVSLELYDGLGDRLPLAFRPEADGSVVYQASVEPGTAYALRVQQPPISAVFTFDTSGSMAHFIDTVVEGIRSFASDVKPGREAVTIVPFEQAPLLPDWENDAYLLQDAVSRYPFDGSSSNAEAGLIAGSDLLAEREGARAILIVTDAETSTRQTDELWAALRTVRPIIFSVHVGGTSEPVAARDRMQDWAASGGGSYTYPTSHGEMDRAFDRMATWLRRPADYSLAYSTLALGPSSLAVTDPGEGADGAPRGLAPGVGVEIILDTSGSMLEKLAGERRIDIARASLEQLVGEALAEDVPVALRTFGGPAKNKKAAKRQRCKTTLTIPLQPLERQTMLQQIRELKASKGTRTPIASALGAIADDLADVPGTRTVVLVTDGDETCEGDPAAAIDGLRAAGIDVTVNIVGFALDDEALKARMVEWAQLGDGTYFDATGADELAATLARALQAPFRVYGPDGDIYEGGTIDGDPILIDPGTYRVEVLTDPPIEFGEVVVAAGEALVLALPPK